MGLQCVDRGCRTVAIGFQWRPPPGIARPGWATLGSPSMSAPRTPAALPLRAIALALLFAACGRSDQVPAAGGPTTGPDQVQPAALVLDGRSLPLRTSFCAAGSPDFAATATGETAEGPFVLVVRGPDVVVVKFGVRRELDVPPAGNRWLYALSGASLHSDGRMIKGVAALTDLRSAEPTTVAATVEVDCA